MLHEERERRKRAQAARRASKDLGEFTRQAWREVLWPTIPLEWNWHHEALCAHLQAAGEAWARGQLAALEEWDAEMEERAERLRYGRGEPVEQHLLQQLFNVPPGTAKSTIISVTFHAWMWQLWPEWSLLALSANPDVAGRDAEFARNIIQHEWYQDTFSPDWAIRKSEDAKSYYRNTRGGFRRSKGMTAKATGGRAHCLLFDDPHDAEEAKSDTMREAVLSRWDTAWSSRVNDERVSLRIGIMQRLQEKDLSGHWLAQGGVRHVCFPLEYEPKRGCRCRSSTPPRAASARGTRAPWRGR
jgi:hypothetical protein